MAQKIGIIIPACNEAPALEPVLKELFAHLPEDGNTWRVAVGINGSQDDSAAVARRAGAIVGETARRGYGHGCQAAINELSSAGFLPDAFIFMAGDGANDPRELPRLLQPFTEHGIEMVLGTRTRQLANYRWIADSRRLSNILLGAYATFLGKCRQRFTDLGPYRLISRDLFERLQMREWTYGWTIEAQLKACYMGALIREIDVRERPRLVGDQKVSGVSLRHTLRVAAHIFSAGRRVQHRQRREPAPKALFHTGSRKKPAKSSLPLS